MNKIIGLVELDSENIDLLSASVLEESLNSYM